MPGAGARTFFHCRSAADEPSKPLDAEQVRAIRAALIEQGGRG